MINIDTALKFNLLGAVARSHDAYHVKNKIIHLVMTCAYWGSLPDIFEHDNFILNKKISNKILIIKIINSWDVNICYEYISKDKNVVICTFSVGYIINNLNNKNKLEFLLEELFGSRNLYKKINFNNAHNDYHKRFRYNHGDVFFIFENLHWYNVKHLFNMMGISISGGSINKRHLLSVTQLNLFRFFLILKVNIDGMFYTTTNIYLNNSLYKTIQSREFFYSEDKNLIIYQLFFQTLEEFHGTLTELRILYNYINQRLRIELDKELNNEASSPGEQILNSPAATQHSSEEIISKYRDMESKLKSLCFDSFRFETFMFELWKSINYIRNDNDFDVTDLLISGITSNLQLTHKSEKVSNLIPYLDLLIAFYSSLYDRRQKLIYKNFDNYVNLVINQKLPSLKGSGYDISSLFENENTKETLVLSDRGALVALGAAAAFSAES